jgi:hypothetical protein
LQDSSLELHQILERHELSFEQADRAGLVIDKALDHAVTERQRSQPFICARHRMLGRQQWLEKSIRESGTGAPAVFIILLRFCSRCLRPFDNSCARSGRDATARPHLV